MQNLKASVLDLKKNEKIISILCYVVPFLCLGGYLLMLVAKNSIQGIYGYYLIHYLYTYDHGFVGRGLVGEVISWFFETVSDDVLNGVILLFSFLLMLSAVLCIGKALNKVKNNSKLFFTVFCLCFIICILPGSFPNYYHDVKLDKLLWALTLFAVFLVDKKRGIYLVPALCVIATLVNPIFLFCSMLLIAIILLQQFYSKSFSKKYGIICATSYILMIVIGVYALISEKFLGFETPGELIDFYFSRYDGVLDESTYHLFETEWLFDYFDTPATILQKSFYIYFIDWGNWKTCVADAVFLMIPSFVVMSLFWKGCMANSSEKFQKFIFFLCLISFFVIIPPIIISWESSKYFYNYLITQLSLVVFFIVSGNAAVLSTITNSFAWMKKNPVITVFLAMYFSAFIFA